MMKHKYRDILAVSWRMSFSFCLRTAHVYAGSYRVSQKYPAPFRHHSIQKSNTICERLVTKNIRPYSDAEGCNPCKSKKNPLKHLISAGWRRWRDSNSRGLLHPYCISSADPSTAWVHLQMKNIQFQCMDNMISRAMEGRFLTLIFSNRLISSLHQSL